MGISLLGGRDSSLPLRMTQLGTLHDTRKGALHTRGVLCTQEGCSAWHKRGTLLGVRGASVYTFIHFMDIYSIFEIART